MWAGDAAERSPAKQRLQRSAPVLCAELRAARDAGRAVGHVQPRRDVHRVVELAEGAKEVAHVARPEAVDEHLHNDELGSKRLDHELSRPHEDATLL